MELVNNRYRVIKSINQNRLVSSYLVVDMKDDYREIVLNILNSEFLPQDLFEYYSREFIILSNIRNANIMSNYNFNIVSFIDNKKSNGDQYFYTSQYYENEMDILTATKDMNMNEILDLFIELCCPVNYLHLKGLMYSEINFSNIIITETDGKYHILLRDLATIELEKYNYKNEKAGSAFFKSPMLLSGEKASRKTDMYSLGVVLLALLQRQKNITFNVSKEMEMLKDHIDSEGENNSGDDEYIFLKNVYPILEKLLYDQNEYPYDYLGELVNDINNTFNLEYSVYIKEEIEKLNFHTKLVGRDSEINHIIKAYDYMIKYQPVKKYFAIHGESGSGKTRFLEEIKYLLQLKRAKIYSSFTLSNLNDSSNKMWVEILRKLIIEADEETIEKYESELIKFFPEIVDRKNAIPTEVLNRDKAKYRLLNRIAGFISDSIKTNPAVIIIDNLHLGNDFTIDTFVYLYNEIVKNKNIIIIFSFSDGESFKNKKFAEFLSTLREKKECEDIILKNLSSEQTALVVQNMLAMPYAPSLLSQRIYSQSYGNPLFVLEIIKNLFSTKTIFINNETGRWNSDYDYDTGYELLPIPNNMEQAVLNQIKDCGDLGHEILKIISVFSNSVSIMDLSDLAKLEVPEIEKAVNELVIKGVLCRKIGDKGYVYDINNKVLKDIVYDKISYKEKIEKHKAAASILEKEYDASIGGNVDELIYHFEKAGLKYKVKKYCIESANRMESLKNRGAEIKNLEKAFSMLSLENKAEKIELSLKIGELYFDDGDVSRAMECFNVSNKIAKNMSHKRYIVDSYIKIARVFHAKNDIKSLNKCIVKIKNVLEEFDYNEGFLECRQLEAVSNVNELNYDSAMLISEELIKECGNEFERIKGDSYKLLGNGYMQEGKIEDAIDFYNRAIKCYEKSNNTKEMLLAMNNIGVIYSDFYQDYETSLNYFIKIKDISEENNYILSAMLAITNMAEIYYTKFKFQDAYNYFKLALEMSVKIDSENSVFYCYNVLSKVSIELNNYEEAYQYNLLSDKELINFPEQGRDIGEHYRCKAELFYLYGSFEEAEKFIRKAINFFKKEDSVINLLSVIQLQYINIRRKDLTNYNTYIKKIINMSLRFVTPESRIKVLCTGAILLLEKGDEFGARKLIEEASKSVIGPITEVVNAQYLYSLGLLSKGNDGLKKLLMSLEIAQKVKNRELIQSISKAIGDYYFSQKNYFYAANYYIEACEMIKDLVYQIPKEYKLKYVNCHNMIKPFRRIAYIKNKYIDGTSELKSIEEKSYIITSNEELQSILNTEVIDEFLLNEDFIKSIRMLHMSFLTTGIFDEKDIIANVGVDTIKNIELIIKYLAGITLATKGILVVEGVQHENTVIASINGDFEPPSNRYIFERVKTTLEPLLILNKGNKNEIDTNVLSKDIKACLCIPICARNNFEDSNNDIDRIRIGYKRANISGYLYLECDRILNNFNQNGLQKCIEITGLLDLLIEKHQLKIAASIDKLTGTLTRKYLEDALTEEIEKAGAIGKLFSIIMYDLDRFKSVNDRFGHQTGDVVLKKVSKIVKDNIGRNDIVGRYGGEEFIIILPDTNVEDAFSVAEELRKKIQNERILGDKAEITVSMGIAAYPVNGQWEQELIEKADQALYVAKENGRNRCQIWDSKFSNKVKGTNKLNGIITGNAVQDSRNVLALVEIIGLINKNISKKDKIYSLLGRIIEIIEAQYGMLLIMNNGKVTERYGRKALTEEWANTIDYNKNSIVSVLEKKLGLYMIDWDDAGSYDLITGNPDWYSIVVVPIIIENDIKGIIYLSASTRFKEFGFNEFNFVNVISDLVATIL